MEFCHLPVMPNETLQALGLRPNGVYLDCTLGGGGHSSLILSRLGENGRVIGLDRDADAIRNAQDKIKDPRFTAVHCHNLEAPQALCSLGISEVDGVLFDLGVSSYQLDNAARGFSYRFDAPLDMRMDVSSPLSAFDVVNTYSQHELERILFDYGEEKYARRIASAICAAREQGAVESTGQLVEIISGAVSAKYRLEGGSPAKRSFQAIRIEVNGELETLEKSLRTCFSLLSSGGRMAVLTFHSLEDRAVKNTFASLVNPCTCPKNLPCVCGKMPLAKPVIRGSLTASDEELAENKRAHSARLRAVERL